MGACCSTENSNKKTPIINARLHIADYKDVQRLTNDTFYLDEVLYKTEFSVIYSVRDKDTHKMYVIKKTNMSQQEEKPLPKYHVRSNCKKEIDIVKALQGKDITLQYITSSIEDDFFLNNNNNNNNNNIVYMMTEAGMIDLLHFVYNSIAKNNNNNNNNTSSMSPINADDVDVFSPPYLPSGLKTLQCLRYMFQIATLVSALHDEGIAHFDLCLENILICHNGKLRLIDFGLSRYLESSKEFHINCDTYDIYNNKLIGKLPILLPEMQRFQPYNAFSNDVFSVGLCFFFLVFGKYPYLICHEPIETSAPCAGFMKKSLQLIEEILCTAPRLSINQVIDTLASL